MAAAARAWLWRAGIRNSLDLAGKSHPSHPSTMHTVMLIAPDAR
jgi:hypothetical protein